MGRGEWYKTKRLNPVVDHSTGMSLALNHRAQRRASSQGVLGGGNKCARARFLLGQGFLGQIHTVDLRSW